MRNTFTFHLVSVVQIMLVLGVKLRQLDCFFESWRRFSSHLKKSEELNQNQTDHKWRSFKVESRNSLFDSRKGLGYFIWEVFFSTGIILPPFWVNHSQHVKCTEEYWSHVHPQVLLAEVTGELGGMLPPESTGTEVGWDKMTFRRTWTGTGLLLSGFQLLNLANLSRLWPPNSLSFRTGTSFTNQQVMQYSWTVTMAWNHTMS